MEEEVKDGQQDGSKVLKTYDANIKKLVAIMGGKITPTKKLPKDDVGNIVQELFKEEQEATKVGVKTDIKELLKTKIALDKAIEEEEKKLIQFKEVKMKEFNKAANDLFQRIEGIGELESAYYTALSSVKEEPKKVK